jgi:hypothetical protein
MRSLILLPLPLLLLLSSPHALLGFRLAATPPTTTTTATASSSASSSSLHLLQRRVCRSPVTTTTMALRLNPFTSLHRRRQQQQQQQRGSVAAVSAAATTTALSLPTTTTTTTTTTMSAVRGGAAPSSPARAPCDWKAIGTYVGATALQLAAIGGFLWCMEWAFAATKLAPVLRLWVVRLFFAFTSLRSRVFSVLDNSRPSVAREEQRKREKKRPGWM